MYCGGFPSIITLTLPTQHPLSISNSRPVDIRWKFVEETLLGHLKNATAGNRVEMMVVFIATPKKMVVKSNEMRGKSYVSNCFHLFEV